MEPRALVAAGALVPVGRLATAWATTSAELASAHLRGALTGLEVQGALHYPSAFLQLLRDAVTQVCRALGGLEPATAWIFWQRAHGALGGHTAPEALQGSPDGLPQVLRLARAWVREDGATP